MEDQSARGSRYIDDVPGLACWTCVIAKFEPACSAAKRPAFSHISRDSYAVGHLSSVLFSLHNEAFCWETGTARSKAKHSIRHIAHVE